MGASLCTPDDVIADCGDESGPPSGGPDVVNQVFTVATGWGYATRCGCGWKTPHDTHDAALDAGQQHMRSEHTVKREPAAA